MPTSPKDEETIKQVVKDGEDAVDVKELVNEMEGEADDPAVSLVSSLDTQRRTRFKEEYSVYVVGENGCGYPFPTRAVATWSWRKVERGAYTTSKRC